MKSAMRMARDLAMVLLLAAVFAAPTHAADKLTIYTVNYPLAYFAERLAGDLAEVRFPAPPDVDPAFWKPGAEVVAAYQRADLILLNGAGYARWVDKASLPRSRLVDTSRAFADKYIQAPSAVTHSHGPGGEHAHSGTAFTTWLDLSQAAQQAEAIAQAVIRKRPNAKDRIARNLAGLKSDLLALDGQIAEIAARGRDRPLLASHPVYQYLARRYGLDLRSVLWEPDAAPDKPQWAEFERLLGEHRAKWMLWEGEPARESIERLRALGVESVVFDPCANRPATGDFLSVMANNARNLEQVFR